MFLVVLRSSTKTGVHWYEQQVAAASELSDRGTVLNIVRSILIALLTLMGLKGRSDAVCCAVCYGCLLLLSAVLAAMLSAMLAATIVFAMYLLCYLSALHL